MFNITSGTVILLGGPVTADASTDLSATVTVTGSGFTRVGGGAALTASGTLQTANVVLIRFAPTTALSAQSQVTASASVHIRAASASLSAGTALTAAGGLLTTDSAAVLSASTTLDAAGGAVVAATVAPLSSTATVVGSGGYALNAVPEPWTAGVDLIASVDPVFRLALPTGKGVFTTDKFFERFPVDTGISLLIAGGTGRLVEYPSQTELDTSDVYYLGGYRHQLTPGERAVIISAGFGDLVEEA